MGVKKVFDLGKIQIYTDDGEDFEVDHQAYEIADLVLAKSDKLTREIVIDLSPDEARTMRHCAFMPQQEL